MAVKMNLKIITKNHAADPEIRFLAKSISKSNGSATAMPTAWELTPENLSIFLSIIGYKKLKSLLISTEKKMQLVLFLIRFSSFSVFLG